jgi:EAL domain-containing protein (putative c-di-GMP-specific phosphodiesterase class I)
MYRAKAEGGNLCRFSSDQIEQRVQHGALVESDLRHALEHGELVLRYQPQINLADAALNPGIGIAGLLHWDHPHLGLVGAERFISLADDSGVLESLTDWMFGAACAQGRTWQGMGFHQLHVAVPLLSRRQLAWSGLAQRIQDCLHAAGLDAARLEIELGEDVLLSESAAGLRALKELGVRVALAGFGRGAISLRSLQFGILDTLKLASEWHHQPRAAADATHADLRAWPNDPSARAGHAAVVGAIIALARDLGLRVVAEAVNDPTQLAFLRQCGCTAVQGLMSDSTLPGPACVRWLRKASGRRDRALVALPDGPMAAGDAGSSEVRIPAEG